MIKLKGVYVFLMICITLILSCKNENKTPRESSTHKIEKVSGKKYISEYEPYNADSTINVIVEIPAGTHQKWEVSKDDETLQLQYIDDKPRVINYLAYPCNYGMIPQSLLPKDMGGDGDPLDVILLGQKLNREEVVPCRIIGMLKLLDNGEQDDKIIAVPINGLFSNIKSMSELYSQYPGVSVIIETWFSNYKGPNEIISYGYEEREAAIEILNFAIHNYSNEN